MGFLAEYVIQSTKTTIFQDASRIENKVGVRNDLQRVHTTPEVNYRIDCWGGVDQVPLEEDQTQISGIPLQLLLNCQDCIDLGNVCGPDYF